MKTFQISTKGILMIYFKFKGEPVGKGRPRVTARRSKTNDNAVFAHAYTPRKTRDFEDAIRFEFMASCCDKMPVYPKGTPLKVDMTFAFGIPKSYSKKKREQCLNGIIQHTKKPDADNVAKAVLDALSGYAMEDDSQVVVMQLEKIYAEEPYVEVKIYPRDWGE